MKKTFKSFTCILLAGLLLAQTPLTMVKAEVVAGEISLGGITEALSRYYEFIKESDQETDTTELYTMSYEAPEGLAVANVESTLNIRKGPGTSYAKVGVLPRYGACIIESIDGNWAKITSGDVKGYVHKDYLIMGEEAVAIAQEHATLYATVNAKVSALNVRKEQSTDADIITKVKAGEKLLVSKEVVINKEDDNAKVWVEVKLNDDENANAVAYVSADYVTISYDLNWATKHTPYGEGVSDLRVAICDYAKQYIGTKYVWGGNSLTKGIDCSGLVQQVFKNFGYKTPRVSRDMAKKYEEISISELQPGDLVFYGKVKENYINHVAIYIGNDQIIHSSTNYKGVAISSMYFYSILKCCRILDEDQ